MSQFSLKLCKDMFEETQVREYGSLEVATGWAILDFLLGGWERSTIRSTVRGRVRKFSPNSCRVTFCSANEIGFFGQRVFSLSHHFLEAFFLVWYSRARRVFSEMLVLAVLIVLFSMALSCWGSAIIWPHNQV